jgi:hypothetical protein
MMLCVTRRLCFEEGERVMSRTEGLGEAPATRAPREGFDSPFEVTAPPGAEGWQEMYSYHLLFSEERREFDEDRFWFQDSLHWPEPLKPFDAMVVECAVVALNQANARLFAVPPSLGVELRLLNGLRVPEREFGVGRGDAPPALGAFR